MYELNSIDEPKRLLGDAEFGAMVLVGQDETRVPCSNGFSFTSSAICMLGRFPFVASLSHPNLVSYVEIIRSNTFDNAVLLIAEHYPHSVRTDIQMKKCSIEISKVVSISCDILSALHYLHSRNVIAGYITSESILLSSDNLARLTQYGLYYVSDNGIGTVSFIGSTWYLSPERLIYFSQGSKTATRGSDVWAFGIVLLEMISGVILSDIWTEEEFLHVLKSQLHSMEGSVLHPLLNAIKNKRPAMNICVESTLLSLLEPILSISSSSRPSARQILSELQKMKTDSSLNKYSMPFVKYRTKYGIFCNGTVLPTKSEEIFAVAKSARKNDYLYMLPLKQAFFLWKLCGSSVENVLLNNGIIKAYSPITALPLIVSGDCVMFGGSSCFSASTLSIFVLPSINLRERIASIGASRFGLDVCFNRAQSEASKLSLLVKEKDIEYQARRMHVFDRLLEAHTYRKQELINECKNDIPPLHRAFVWAALLNVSCSAYEQFSLLDTFTEHPSDRQLMVDIPRCHQYDELMASPTAHQKLKRLLKFWLISHTNYVYWQGLDSLMAPFLVLHFERLPYAFTCFESFISLYLNNFFLKDNSAVIQEYLTVFNHLLAFLDAKLFCHLSEMDFSPELYAIPWFLTCFAHVLPLHKLFYVWDSVLLSDSSFPLFVGLALMEQMRPRLISATFNDAILLFSDLPDLNMEQILQCSQYFYESVPSSCTYRQYSSKHLREVHGMKQRTVTELKGYICPRLSVNELVRILSESTALLIDLRTANEFSRCSLSGSINLPQIGDMDSLDSIRAALKLAQEAGHIIVFIDGPPGFRAQRISNICVKEGYDHICVLDDFFDDIHTNQNIVSYLK